MSEIIIKGTASQKILLQTTLDQNLEATNLMNFLRENNIPIASSCNGEGVCKKCIVNTNILSCQTTIKQLRKDESTSTIIEIAYL